MKQNQVQQKAIRLGTHGENYGSWMSNPVFYVLGALLALSVVLAVLSFTVFHITALGVVFVIAAAILLALLLWCAWIRRQYAFGRLRAIIHPGGPDVAGGKSNGH